MRPAEFFRLSRRAVAIWRQDGPKVMVHRLGKVLEYRLLSQTGYAGWRLAYDVLWPWQKPAMARRIANLPARPAFALLLKAGSGDRAGLEATAQSLIRQLYPDWRLLIDIGPLAPPVVRALERLAARDPRITLVASPAGSSGPARLNGLLDLAGADTFVGCLSAGDQLAPSALYWMAEAWLMQPEARLIYSDEDRLDAIGRRHRPYLKPEWDPDRFAAEGNAGRLWLMPKAAIDALGGFAPEADEAEDFDLLLRAGERFERARLCHLPRILAHRSSASFAHLREEPALRAAHAALGRHVARGAVPAEVILPPAGPPFRVRYALPETPPRVSLVIPTRDRVDLLAQCVEGLLHETDYPDLEIVIIDNGSHEPDTLAYLRRLEDGGVKVIRDERPFNYSALNNRAVSQASGSLIGLLNNDVKVIHEDWLREMVSQALRPGVGAVGAKLYYPDGSLQHGGVVVGLGGVAGHIYLGVDGKSAGAAGDLNLVREVSCVTAACLVMRKDLFEAVGGLDEERLAIAFNDVDLCLKLRRAGHRILWTPYARLYHFESASRGSDLAPDKIMRFRAEYGRMREMWGSWLDEDPFYNPNRTQEGCAGGLAFPPRLATAPWRLPG